MALRWIFTCLLLSGLTCGTVWGETVPCVRSRELCRSKDYSSVTTINDISYCCASGYSLTMRNAACYCTKDSEAVPCTRGSAECDNAPSVSTDSQGNLVCCQQGFRLQNQVRSVNGQVHSSCTCTPFLRLGRRNIISINSNGGMAEGSGNSSGVSASNNSDVSEQKQNLKFRDSMRKTMQAMSKQMQAMIRQMKGAARRMERMRARMESFFTNMFRG